MIKVVNNSSAKHCPLDPMPTWLLKECKDETVPVITRIVNFSFETSTMPDNLKVALLSPHLKRFNLDFEIFNNFRPLSNLAYLSKLIEKVAVTQVCDFMELNDLYDLFQSCTFNRNHIT